MSRMEITPGNYSVKLIEQIAKDKPWQAAGRGDDHSSWVDICARLRRAVHFQLPDCGILLPRNNKPRLGLEPSDLIPPFNDVVIEYTALTGKSIEGQSLSSRRIALISRITLFDVEYARIAIFPYIDDMRIFGAMPIAAFIPLNEFKPKRYAYLLSEKVGIEFLPILPATAEQMATSAGGRSEFVAGLALDFEDEITAYCDLCLALGCSNVATETVPAEEKLNCARARTGKLALFDYKVLVLGGVRNETEGASSGSGSFRRSHLRRGHIRRCASGVKTWVNACMVIGSAPGFIHKDYRVIAA